MKIKYKAPNAALRKRYVALNSGTPTSRTSRKSSTLSRPKINRLHYPILSTPVFMSLTQSAWQTSGFTPTHAGRQFS